ncbi:MULTISPECIES: hypothetical protein [Frankia]|nr:MULTISPECIES: hypothetical protein [Frankia]
MRQQPASAREEETEAPSRRDLVALLGSAMPMPMPDAVPDRARWMMSGEQEAYEAG